jgi:hypothetical protein
MRIGLGGRLSAPLGMCVVCAAALTVPPACGASPHHTHHSAQRPKPALYELTFAMSGRYVYHYNAQAGPQSERLMHFEPVATYRRVPLVSKGRPPASRRRPVVVHASSLPELVGSWAMSYFDPSGEDSCQAGGALSPNPAPSPALRATYSSHGYSLVVQAVPAVRPFLYSSTEIGGPCGATDPWSEWVIRGGAANGGINTLSASLRIGQGMLRSVESHQPAKLAVALDPSQGFAATDCGTAPALEVTCDQALEWTGTVTIRRARRAH